MRPLLQRIRTLKRGHGRVPSQIFAGFLSAWISGAARAVYDCPMTEIDKSAIRDAATVIAVRDPEGTPSVLMGQRGAKAAFMPNKFVFPGGAVDPGDRSVPVTPLPEPCNGRADEGPGAAALAVAAIRELWEETGLILGASDAWPDPPEDWRAFAKTGHRPDASDLRFVFRALTPPGRPRRFDARFFLVDARRLVGDLDDFSRASDELSHLQWVPLSQARSFDLPFITEIVLAEIAQHVPEFGPPRHVPYFRNNDEESAILSLRGG